MLEANVDRMPLKLRAVTMKSENRGYVGEEYVVSQGSLFSQLA